MAKSKGKQHPTTKKRHTILLRRRVIISAVLVILAGLGTLGVIVWTSGARADVAFDPYFTLSTGPAKIRIFQPLNRSVDNADSVTASGTAPPNMQITLKVDGVTKATTSVSDKGVWSKTVSGLSEGDHSLTATGSINGPFTVVAAKGYIPAYSIIDLSTNGQIASSTVGLPTAFSGLYFGSYDVNASDALRVNDQIAYLIRERSVSVLNMATQQVFKTIFLSDQFSSGGDTPTDTGGQFKQSLLSADGSRVYILYSNEGGGKIVAINTADNSLVSTGGFPATVVPGATDIVATPDGSRLYVAAYNSDEIDSVSTGDGNIVQHTVGASVHDVALSGDGQKLYISKASQFIEETQDSSFYIAAIDTANDTLNDTAIDIGGSLQPGTIYASSLNDRLYIGGTNDTNIRILNTSTDSIEGSLAVASSVQLGTNNIVESDDGSRVYFPLTDDSIAVIDHGTDTLLASIAKPASSFTGLQDLMFYDNKIYGTYTRAPDPVADLLNSNGNPSSLYSSLAVATSSATTTGSKLVPVSVNGAISGQLSDPVVTNPIPVSGEISFSVGDPIAITSPTVDTTLDTATPTIKGTGPKGKVIQLSINGGAAVDVKVDNNGAWQKQVSLPKNKKSTIAAVYNNKRTQLVLPNTFIFGSDIAKNQLSVIDGESGLEQNPVTLPPFGIDTVKINTSAAINPNGQRYYVVNTDLTTFLTNTLQIILAGDQSQQDTDPFLQELQSLPSSQLGGIDVYSSVSTNTLKSRILLPDGLVPLSIVVSPNGKRAMVSTFDIQQLINLISSEVTPDTATLPMKLVSINLDKESVIGDPIATTFELPTGEGLEQAQKIGALIGGLVSSLSKPGSFNAAGNKFYTTAFRLGKINVIDTDTGAAETVTLPGVSDYTIIMNIQLNPDQNALYMSYVDVSVPTGQEGNPLPGITSGFMVVDASTYAFLGKATLPQIPLFNFAVSKSGSKLYFATVNAQEIFDAATAATANPEAVFIDTLPTFSLGIYDVLDQEYTSQPISNNEIPYNLVLSPDESQVFIPTLLHNVVHIYDVDSDTMDAGNAPILLPGISTAIATTSNVGETIIGSYNASASYFVPPDAPPVLCIYDSTILANSPNCKAPDENNVIYKFLQGANSSTSGENAQSLDIPEQTIQVIRANAQKALSQQESTTKGGVLRTWLAYIVYLVFIATLGATGYVVWRTDALIGQSEDESYM